MFHKGRRWVFLTSSVALIVVGGAAAVILMRGNLLSIFEDPIPIRNLLDSTAKNEGSIGPLFPLTMWDYIGFAFCIVGLVLAAGGGVGGGGILVPVYILLLRFPVMYAIPLANVTVFGGGVSNNILNARKRHPLADRPMIDWDLVLMMEPLTMAGSLVGSYLTILLPDTVIVVMLVFLLSFTAYKTLRKAQKMHDEESSEKHTEIVREIAVSLGGSLDYDEIDGTGAPLPLSSRYCKENNDVEAYKLQDGNDITDSSRIVLEQILEEERRTPYFNVMLISTLSAAMIGINILSGGGDFPSPLGIECGSVSYYLMKLSALGWVLVVCAVGRTYLVNRTKIKEQVNYEYVEGDICWDKRSTIVYPAICTIAGFAAGLFGIGGGIVKGPLMLAMGVHPSVASATSACMILFTSFTATTSYAMFGVLQYDYAVVCFGVGFLATIAGQIGMTRLLGKNPRYSYIAFSIGIVVAISAFFMAVSGVIKIVEGESQEMKGICTFEA